MKKALPLSIFVLLLAGCFKQSIRPGRSELELVYLTDLSKFEGDMSGLKALGESEPASLLVVDDPCLSTIESLAWWEGEREISLLEALGCDLFFPPAEWCFLGPERLYDLSSRVEFFIVALDVVDEENNYPLSRYMIHQQSPYRVAVSAGLAPSDYAQTFTGLRRLPPDSILPITASFLRMQSDFFLFFDGYDSLPEGIYAIPRGGKTRWMKFRFVSRVEFKLKEWGVDFESMGSGEEAPLALWQAHADSLDARVLGTCEESLTIESLEILANKALKRLAEDRFSVDDIGILIPEGFITGEIPAGRITFGMMRKILAPEIFFLVSMKDLPDDIASRSRNFSLEGEIQAALLPSSLCLADDRFQGKSLKITGITSARIARQMFARDVEVEDK